MASSLRSRLWWSYALVTFSALAVVTVTLLVYIFNNPSTYRQANAQLVVVAAAIRKNQPEWTSKSTDELQVYAEKMDKAFGTRVVVYAPNRRVIADSQADEQSTLKMPTLPRLRPYSVTRDMAGKAWLYGIRKLDNGEWILIAVPRPTVPFLTIFTDELMLPVALAAGFALIVSLLVAFWLANWVGNPLQEIVYNSRKMPSAEVKAVNSRGPSEVQELVQAFNDMNRRVQNTYQSQRAFIANVSHELKTPLTSVQGFAQAILDGTASEPDSQRKAAQVIYDESARMYRMVLDLLDLARLDAGTLELKRDPLDLTALLNNVAQKLSPQASASQVTINVKSDALPQITGDGDHLAQVFTNLIDNALKFTPPGGSIILDIKPIGSSAQIEVTDTGAGIPTAALPHIFERFFQGDPSRPGGARHGTGLGLAIAKEIVTAHGGTINVRSEPGKGSTFTVILPLVPPGASIRLLKRKK
jgi:signal transduction histidine kinase